MLGGAQTSSCGEAAGRNPDAWHFMFYIVGAVFCCISVNSIKVYSDLHLHYFKLVGSFKNLLLSL